MALPALILAPLAGLIGALTTKLLDGIITLFTKKFLIHAALIVMFLAFYGTFIVGINALMSSIPVTSIPGWMVTGFKVLPSVTDDCIAALIAGRLVVFLFNFQREILDIRKS